MSTQPWFPPPNNSSLLILLCPLHLLVVHPLMPCCCLAVCSWHFAVLLSLSLPLSPSQGSFCCDVAHTVSVLNVSSCHSLSRLMCNVRNNYSRHKTNSSMFSGHVVLSLSPSLFFQCGGFNKVCWAVNGEDTKEFKRQKPQWWTHYISFVYLVQKTV